MRLGHYTKRSVRKNSNIISGSALARDYCYCVVFIYLSLSLQLWFKQLMVNFRKLYTAGYSLSLLLLVTALIILLSFRYIRANVAKNVHAVHQL